jgi:MFS family permease
MVNLGATTAGQLMLTTGDPNGFTFFAIAAIFYCLALVPTAISSTSTPAPLVHVKLDLKALWRNSPVAVIGVLFVGVSNSAFGTLAAVYADRVGLVLATIALFTSIPILVGALVLVGLTVLALAADTAFLVLAPESRVLNLVLAGILGGSIFAMYPVIVAHANDHAAPGTAIQISGGLLLLYGVGGIIGPLLAGWAMAGLADRALFMVTAGSHVVVIFYTLWRILQSEAVAVEDKKEFQMAVGGRASTPQTAVFADADNQIDATP